MTKLLMVCFFRQLEATDVTKSWTATCLLYFGTSLQKAFIADAEIGRLFALQWVIIFSIIRNRKQAGMELCAIYLHE
jgi:hypothetical protein